MPTTEYHRIFRQLAEVLAQGYAENKQMVSNLLGELRNIHPNWHVECSASGITVIVPPGEYTRIPKAVTHIASRIEEAHPDGLFYIHKNRDGQAGVFRHVRPPSSPRTMWDRLLTDELDPAKNIGR